MGVVVLGRACWSQGDGVSDPNSKWEMVSLIPMFDPPRHDTKDTIEKCHHQVRCAPKSRACAAPRLLSSGAEQAGRARGGESGKKLWRPEA